MPGIKKPADGQLSTLPSSAGKAQGTSALKDRAKNGHALAVSKMPSAIDNGHGLEVHSLEIVGSHRT